MADGANPVPRLSRIEVVANVASGSVQPDVRERVEAIVAEAGVSARIDTPACADLNSCIRAALDRGPDLLVIIAGDGTARCAAEMAGMDGPLVAPLPGGTMNLLPRALYGERDWETALRDTLESGCVRPVSGGEVGGHKFYVGALLGAPALWALAREAVRERKLGLAVRRAKRAARRAFSGRLRFSIDGGLMQKAEALQIMCPLVSKALSDDDHRLEAIALDPAGAADAFRLGIRTLRGNWRDDPAVEVFHCRSGQAWASGIIPASIDGEPIRLPRNVEIRYLKEAFRSLAPPPPDDPPTPLG
ncbi:MAG TPA: diacylglycerol kinase family protein [Caulobacteraceae bacterium]|nr:diacylglycerol kinase family protein [Caulobacteraceae bacterium]